MNKIVEVAKNSKKILADSAGQPVQCPNCPEKWFSPFDKLYVAAYGKCCTCENANVFIKNSENVFNIVDVAL